MFSLNRVKRVLAMACWAAAVFTDSSATWVAAETTGAIRSDYDKNDYILYMTTVIEGDSKPGQTGEDGTHAGRESHRQGTGRIDGLSGSQGDHSVQVNVGKNKKLPNPTNFYAITGLGLEERRNNPCVLKLYGTLVDPRYQGDVRVVAEHELERCNHLFGGVDYKDVNFPKSEKTFDFRVEGKHFVRKVKVCGGHATLLPQQAHTHQMWEIKGVKAVASEVKLDDSPVLKANVVERQTVEKFIRANCPNRIEKAAENKPGWSVWSECPTGQIATGVRAYYGEDRYFTGLQLACQSVASRRVESLPIKDANGY